MKKGDLCYLNNPDHQSGKLINQGHGYIWLYARESNNPVLAYFTSFATGEAKVFFRNEMQPTKKEQTND